ncbi:TMhelix containing protein [Vibrio phage 2.275.O._10N.286.54.E11]|nr:TMhelix containing protein [Vibrio phage 2.275.O._10N.286.54.E11]
MNLKEKALEYLAEFQRSDLYASIYKADPYELFFGIIFSVFMALFLALAGIVLYSGSHMPISATIILMPFMCMMAVGIIHGLDAQSISARKVFWGGILLYVVSHALGTIGFGTIILCKALF